MAYVYLLDGVWTEINGSFVLNSIQYPENFAALATPDERSALNIRELAYDLKIPAGYRATGSTIEDRDGVPTFVQLSEPSPVADVQRERWEEVKRIRDLEITNGAPTQFGIMDADDTSRINISGAVQMAQIAKMTGNPFSIEWTLHDNTSVTLDADKMIAVGLAVGSFTARIHARAQALRKQIDDAVKNGADAKTLYDIDIRSGWKPTA